MTTFTLSSGLGIPPADFWADQSLASVNYELGPCIHMTAPASWQTVRLADWQGGDALFRSWVLLLGVLPVDRHAFGSFAFTPETGFVEVSSSWVNRLWRHERAVEATEGGCVVRDTVAFAPRLRLVSPILAFIYTLVFRHRHHRLKARYGGVRV